MPTAEAALFPLSETDNPKLTVRQTSEKGVGVFALEPIKKGEKIGVYDGAVYDEDYADWPDEDDPRFAFFSDHIIQIDQEKWRSCVGVMHFMNHSCEPNVGVRNRCHYYAMRDISAGEEICWDYEMTERSDWWRMECKCGLDECRKVIGAGLPVNELQSKYPGFFSEWLLQ